MVNLVSGQKYTRLTGRILLCICSCILGLALTGSAAADFELTYRAKSATLVLFNQPQPSPFAAVEARIYVRGDRVRFEVKDHWGRRHVWISNRSTQEVIHLLNEERYEIIRGGWSCKDLPSRLASVLAEALSASGIDSLSISGGETGTWQSSPARTTQWAFRAPVFGLPRPVWIFATVYFPTREAERFGAESAELYCGSPPGEAAWRAALEDHLDIPAEACRTLARTLSLPLALDFRTELGMGTATLLLEATGASSEPLDEGLFRAPAGYSPVDPAE